MCVCACIYINTCMCVRVYVHFYACMYVSMFECLYVGGCQGRKWMFVCLHELSFSPTHIHAKTGNGQLRHFQPSWHYRCQLRDLRCYCLGRFSLLENARVFVGHRRRHRKRPISLPLVCSVRSLPKIPAAENTSCW